MPIEFTDEGLTSYSGLMWIDRFLGESGWLGRIRKVFADREFDNDYGSWRMTLCVIALRIVGGHLAQLGCDPICPVAEASFGSQR